MPRARRGRGRGGRGASAARGRRPAAPKHRITITSVDMMEVHNQEVSNTNDFNSPAHVVVRRGNQFDIIVNFSDPIDTKKVTVEFHRGTRARATRGTKFTAFIDQYGRRPRRYYEWEMKEISTGKNQARYSVQIPPDAPVGSYLTYIKAPAGDRGITTYQADQETVILFNPWCKDDSVWMSDEAEREEYVLNETGLIWAGTSWDKFTWHWNFAQFETVSLEAMLYMLDLFNVSSDDRRSPIQVSKALTEMVNVNDADGGCLVGNWSSDDSDYADGIQPTSWSGSEAILRQYVTNKRPVRYGQCWVFGGTLTTVLRTVGIPARPVTNFRSAHDGDANRAIDYYYDKNGQPVDSMSSDSIWNYHVWVEGWMARPDLKGPYGGWQALDATPQELSPHTATMVVGPAPISAIKDGLDAPYDCEFVIAEVNADIKYHFEGKDGTFKVLETDTRRVGSNISTKAVGSNSRVDLTQAYKYPEGSAAERAALGTLREAEPSPPGGVKFQATMVPGKKLGEEVVCEVKLTSQDAVKSGGVQVTLTAESVQYTGVAGKRISKDTRTVWASGTHANNNSLLTFSIKPEQYLGAVGEQPLIGVTVLAYVKPTEQAWISKLSYRLQLPEVDVNVDGKGKVVLLKAGKTVNVVASLMNPLKKPMTNVVFYVEGAGLISSQEFPAKDTPVGKKATVTFPITPRQLRKKKATLIVTCKSQHLKGVMGTATVTVME